jgi:hypothetical protein
VWGGGRGVGMMTKANRQARAGQVYE